jgi:hypothetical protein
MGLKLLIANLGKSLMVNAETLGTTPYLDQ